MALVDQWGYPIDSRLINATSQTTGRPYLPTRTESINRSVNLQDWRTLLSLSRRLWANNGIVKGATAQKAMHSVGRAWNPVFRGADQEWGKVASEWLLLWYGTSNVRGDVFDFKTSLYLQSIAIDRDGDQGVLLTASEDGMWPMLQTIPAHRIGQRSSTETTVENGPYKGLKISHGVITNRVGRAVAYRVLADEEGDDKDVSARDLILAFDPEWADQLRGLPLFSHALNDLRDADQSQYWEQLNQMASSSRTLIETNESGQADVNDPAVILNRGENSVDTSIERLEGGTITYFKAGTGSKLEQFVNMRPGADWDQFQDRLARKALLGVGWPYSLCWKPDGQNGTQERAEIEKARTTILDRQELLKPVAQRIIGYAISKAIKSGILPEYKGSDLGGFLKWDFTLPPKFSIDLGRDSAARREDYKLGFKNLSEVIAEQGQVLDQHMDARERETVDVINRAKRISDQTGIDFGTALSMLQQRTASGQIGGGLSGTPVEI
jgi:capsid protein